MDKDLYEKSNKYYHVFYENERTKLISIYFNIMTLSGA